MDRNAPLCCARCSLSVNALKRGVSSANSQTAQPFFDLNLNVDIQSTVLKQQVTQNGVQHAEQRGSRARQATQTPVAATQDSHTDQTALQLGHRALPVPQQDPGEAATRAEKNPHVLALLGETVTFSPSKASKRLNEPNCSRKIMLALQNSVNLNASLLIGLAKMSTNFVIYIRYRSHYWGGGQETEEFLKKNSWEVGWRAPNVLYSKKNA